MSKCGIYQITCKTTGHRYIGSAEDIERRWVTHKAELARGKHHNKALQYAWTLFGETDFELTVLEETKPDVLTRKEIEYIDTLNPEFSSRPPGKRSEGRKKKLSTTLRLTEETFFQLQDYCKAMRVSQTDVTEKAILEYLKKYGYRPHYVLKVTKDCYVLTKTDSVSSSVVDVQLRNGLSPEALQTNYQIKFQSPVDLVVDEGVEK
jgi:predicted GIY-YIG superfamily endonuclease